jgi:hypothetical protein
MEVCKNGSEFMLNLFLSCFNKDCNYIKATNDWKNILVILVHLQLHGHTDVNWLDLVGKRHQYKLFFGHLGFLILFIYFLPDRHNDKKYEKFGKPFHWK